MKSCLSVRQKYIAVLIVLLCWVYFFRGRISALSRQGERVRSCYRPHCIFKQRHLTDFPSPTWLYPESVSHQQEEFSLPHIDRVWLNN